MDFRTKLYVPADARRQAVAETIAQMRQSGRPLAPVAAIRGTIAKSFWGKAWCTNLERYSDLSSRLPRGRTYLRNGSVLDLQIEPGEAGALVMGSELYRVSVKIEQVLATHWQAIAQDCSRSIDTLVELLQGQLSTSVMERITRAGTGLFPSPREISFRCSCPDSARMCKHVAATLYGIGARLDAEPELIFRLRRVEAKDLIARAGEGEVPLQKTVRADRILDASTLDDLFGLDLGSFATKASQKRPRHGNKKSLAECKRTSSPRKGRRP